MNRILLAALTFAVAGSAASAQQTISLPEPIARTSPASEIKEGPSSPFGPAMAEESAYVWVALHYHRYAFDEQGMFLGDSNQINLQVPVQYGTVALRGVGNIFAPKYFQTLFSGTVYTATTGLHDSLTETIVNDQDYIDQFKGAGAFTISAVNISLYENPNNVNTATQAPTSLSIYKFRQNLTSAAYRTNGVRLPIDSFQVVEEREISPEGVDTTIVDGRINRTIMVYDPPLQFADGENAIIMFQNTEAAAIQPSEIATTSNPSTAEYQNVRGVLETMPGGTLMTGYKSLGVLLLQFPTGYEIASAYRVLSFGAAPNQVPAVVDLDIQVFGSVDLVSGVRYHFGSEAGGQGVGNVAPNPVSADTRVPFTLTERSSVSIDLYNAAGQHVRSLGGGSYIPGVYSTPLMVGDLENGVYLVRMIAGAKVYTQKIVVNR